mmetsp:Transcript_17161/g.35822  ORF Transcript_17161/g.35822 Transcript_17161/m.35822 type:complete len:124 (-) Transcript_17161:3726-4097(-)
MDQLKSYNVARRRDDDPLIPLDRWVESESALATNDKSTANQQNNHDSEEQKQISFLRRATVAYGITELVRRFVENKYSISDPDNLTLQNICSIHNFLIRVFPEKDETIDTGWEVTGVVMKVPH